MKIKSTINQEVIFENDSTAMVTEDYEAKRLICSDLGLEEIF